MPLPAGLTGPDTEWRCLAFFSVSRPRNLEGPVPGPGTGRIGSSIALRTSARDGPPPRVEPSSSNGRPRGTSLMHRRSCRPSHQPDTPTLGSAGCASPGFPTNGGNHDPTAHGLIPGGGNRTKNGIPESLPIGLVGGVNDLLRPVSHPRRGTPTPRTRTKEVAARPRTVSQDPIPSVSPAERCNASHSLHPAVGDGITLRPLQHDCGVAAELPQQRHRSFPMLRSVVAESQAGRSTFRRSCRWRYCVPSPFPLLTPFVAASRVGVPAE